MIGLWIEIYIMKNKKLQEKKGLKFFFLLPWPCAFGMIILKEESPPLVVQKVRLIKLYIKKKTMKKDLFIMIYTFQGIEILPI